MMPGIRSNILASGEHNQLQKKARNPLKLYDPARKHIKYTRPYGRSTQEE